VLVVLMVALVSSHESKRAAVGIQKRIPWTDSRIKGSLEPPSPYKIERVFSRLEFNRPTDFSNAPDSERLFVVELMGKIHSFPNRPDVKKADLFGDLSKIKGFYRAYGITFHPRFAENRTCYVCYVLEADKPDGSRVSRFRVSNTDPPVLEPDSEEIVITWLSGGHNGGCLKFGPDGCLYISTGDGGQAFPPDTARAGQDISNLQASILRIDVDHPAPGKLYSIPKDNPFVDVAGARGEVWAYGLRNPWKMCFDPANGDLWVGDVGWELWEMIYRIERGGNYGWSITEGRQPVHQEAKRGPTPILPPTVEHSHTESRSITGGYVYRGKRLPDLNGTYVYGDYITGKIWGVRHDGKKVTWQKELFDSSVAIICFGVDNAGELLIVGYDGTLHRLVPNPSATANLNFPRKLSETGLFASVKGHTLAPGVIPYSINAPAWMDGATAERFFALPGVTQFGLHEKTDVYMGWMKGEWAFPEDSVIGKTLAVDAEDGKRRLETQVLHLDGDTWRAYTYIWNDEQTDAELAPAEGLDRTVTVTKKGGPAAKQVWHFASRTECILCHTTRAGSIHAFTVGQMNRDHQYGEVIADQLKTLDHIGLFGKPLPGVLTRAASPHDASLSLDERARSYLHVNCAHCHRRGGGGTAAIDLQSNLKLDKTNLASRPTQGTFDIFDAHVLAPGDPYRSVLYYRLAKLGRGHMPQFGCNVVDEAGLKLVHDWIRSMPAKQDTPAAIAAVRKKHSEATAFLADSSDDKKTSAAIDSLLADPSGALLLLRAWDDGRVHASAQEKVLARITPSTPAQISDLFERFIPEEKRRKRLGTFVKAEEILALPGDRERGRQLFFTSQQSQCRNCHRINGMGTEYGPDLSTIGKKLTAHQLLESMLEPSKNIDPKYATYLVETSQGAVLSGLLVRRNADEIVLRTPENKEVRVAAGDVELVAPQQRSLMPEQLLRDLTAQEVADLLAFMSALK